MGRMVQMERMRLRNLRGGPQSPESEASEDPETGGRGPRLSSFPKDIVASCLHIQQRRKHSDTLKCCKFWVELTTKALCFSPFTVLSQAFGKGKPCSGTSNMPLGLLRHGLEKEPRTEPCGSMEKPLDCVLSEWGEWTRCSATCNGGVRVTMRRVMKEADYGGAACSATLRCVCVMWTHVVRYGK